MYRPNVSRCEHPLLPGDIEVAAGFFEKAVLDDLSDGEWLRDF